MDKNTKERITKCKVNNCDSFLSLFPLNLQQITHINIIYSHEVIQAGEKQDYHIP